MQGFLVLAGCALVLAAPLKAGLGFQPALLVDARGDYENESVPGFDGTQDGAFSGQLLFVPGLTFGDKDSLVPLLGVLSSGRSVAIQEDSLFVQTINVILRPQYRRVLGQAWSLDLWGAARHGYNKANDQEALGTDPYDTEEYGGGAGLEWAPGWSGLSRTELGVELLHRHYPNWKEVAAAITGNSNYYDKDYWGPRVTWTFNGPKAPTTWTLEADWQHEMYTDSLLIDPLQGTYLAGTARVDDWFHGEAALRWSRGPWTWALNLGADGNSSNQNELDAVGSVPVVVKDFYSYSSVQAGPALTWTRPDVPNASVTASAYWLNRTYNGRLIRNQDASFAQGLEADFEQHYIVDARWPLWRGLCAVGGADYTLVKSNTDFAFQYQPSYGLLSLNLGLRYQL